MRVPWYLMAKGKGGSGYKTASGPIVSVNDALAAPLRSLLVNVEPVQDLHGYDNPWPAGGGKNLLDPSTASALGTIIWFCEPNGFLFKKGVSYTFSVSNIADVGSISIYTTDKTTQLAYSSGPSRQSVTYTPTEDTYGLPRLFRTTPITQAIVDGTMIEIGSARTTFAPYSNICPISGWSAVNVWVKPAYDPTANPTATIQLGDTYYDGTLDVTNGVLTVDRKMVDMGTLIWAKDPNRQGVFYASVTGKKSGGSPVVACSVYQIINVPVETTHDKYISGKNSYGNGVFARDTSYSNASDFKTAVTGQTAVYELATPIEISLTPTEISTLQGQQNNVWADSGDVTIEYLASGGANPDLMKLAVAFMGRD